MKMNLALATTIAVLTAAFSFGDTAARYVQNGLLACWDGYENAGKGVHNPSATVWKDLVGGREFSLTGVTVGTDRMVFAGTANSYGLMGKNDTAATFEQAGGGTLEIVYASATGTGSQIILQSSTKSGITFSFYNTTTIIASIATATTFSYSSGTATNSVSVLYDSTKPTAAYADGDALPALGSDYWGSQADKTTIGTRNSKANNHFKGSIYCIRLYDRHLTEREIARNYAIDMRRFREGNLNDDQILEVSSSPAEYALFPPHARDRAVVLRPVRAVHQGAGVGDALPDRRDVRGVRAGRDVERGDPDGREGRPRDRMHHLVHDDLRADRIPVHELDLRLAPRSAVHPQRRRNRRVCGRHHRGVRGIPVA